MNRKVEIRTTGDGSHTLFVPELNENYHSYHGAYAESMHVFIHKGIEQMLHQDTIRIFEVGFGTGLNAILSFAFSQSKKHKISYTGIEKYPVDLNLIEQLNYKDHWKDRQLNEVYMKLHQMEWNQEMSVSPYFDFLKIQGDVLSEDIANNHYHVIYFDAFAPEKQPEMWSLDLLKKLYESLAPSGILVTYCAKGQFKRDLKSSGFLVETIDGPPGKREMVRGVKAKNEL